MEEKVRNATEKTTVSAADVNRRLIKLQKSVDALVKHQRLATIFVLQGNGAELSVTAEQFEPNRAALKKNIERIIRDENNDIPDIWAYVVIKRSGLDMFIDSATNRNLQRGLARLRANCDTLGAIDFARDVIAQL